MNKLLVLACILSCLYACNGPDQKSTKDSMGIRPAPNPPINPAPPPVTPTPLPKRPDSLPVVMLKLPHYVKRLPDTIKSQPAGTAGNYRFFNNTRNTHTPALNLGPCSNVEHVISTTGFYFDAGANPGIYLPGDTITVDATPAWQYFAMDNLHGTASCGIYIRNKNGQVVFRGGSSRMSFNHCSYTHITGTGTPSVRFGFYAADSVANSAEDDIQGVGFQILGRSNNIEIDHCASYRKTYCMWVKTDPACADSLNYPNWHMDQIKIHDFKCDTTYQDVFYIGNTSPTAARAITCSGVTSFPVPMRLSNIEVYNIRINWARRTGIQTSGVDAGNNSVHDCYVYNVGHEDNQQQGYGYANGGMSSNVRFYNDTSVCTFLYGFGDLGVGRNWVDHCVFDSVGYIKIAPGLNRDSLITAIDTYWFTTFGIHNVLAYTGNYLKNIVSQPSNILIDTRSTLNSTTGVSVNNQGIANDSSTIYASFCKFGVNMTVSDIWVYESLKTYNYNASIIGCNTKLDGVTPAVVDTRHLHEPAFANFVYTTNCAAIPVWGGGGPPPPPPPPPPVFQNFFNGHRNRPILFKNG